MLLFVIRRWGYVDVSRDQENVSTSIIAQQRDVDARVSVCDPEFASCWHRAKAQDNGGAT